jgi:hypothetical protein
MALEVGTGAEQPYGRGALHRVTPVLCEGRPVTSIATRRGLACASLLLALHVGAAASPVAFAADCPGRSCAGGAEESDAAAAPERPPRPGKPADPGKPDDPGKPTDPAEPPAPPAPEPVVPPPAAPPSTPPAPPVPADPDVPVDAPPPTAPPGPPTEQDRRSGPVVAVPPGAEGGSPLSIPPQQLLAQLPPQQALEVAEDRVTAARRLLAEAEADAAMIAERVGRSERRSPGGSLPGAVKRGGGATPPAPPAPGAAPSDPQPSPFSSTSAQSERRGFDSPDLLLLIVVGWVVASALATAVVAALGRGGSSAAIARSRRSYT